MRAPAFWWRARGLTSALLTPIAAAYGRVAGRRLARGGVRAGVPVVCVGNPTLGGAGKTPLALALARLLMEAGERPVFLTRGYGGRLNGPVRVEPARHRAIEIGDEPLLLARLAPTIVATDRIKGAAAAVGAGAGVIVMDDGFQNPSLCKDLAILVIDGHHGVGNGRVFPAGPLRAPLVPQLDRTHAVMTIGPVTGAGPIITLARARRLPVFAGRLAPDRPAIAALAGQKVLAFAGIGDARKFFATLEEAGIDAPVRRAFADHHRYTTAEARALLGEADRLGLIPLTTEKDAARLAGDALAATLAARARSLPVTLEIDEAESFRQFVLDRITQARLTRKISQS
jgi:tetraacyldisaccharide 4'-kinase